MAIKKYNNVDMKWTYIKVLANIRKGNNKLVRDI